MHFKYQSAVNLNWFIGFDQSGNPIRAATQSSNSSLHKGIANTYFNSKAGSVISDNKSNSTTTNKQPETNLSDKSTAANQNHDHNGPESVSSPVASSSTTTATTAASLAAMNNQKRCYQFTKLSLLLTDTEEFPEAFDVMAARERRKSLSNQREGAFISSGLKQSSSDSIHSRKSSLSQQTTGNSSMDRSSTSVTTFDQAELINMSRFRNVLKYRLRKSGKSQVACC